MLALLLNIIKIVTTVEIQDKEAEQQIYSENGNTKPATNIFEYDLVVYKVE